MTIGVNESTYVGRTRVTVEKTKKPGGVRSSVATHEASHAVIAMVTGAGVVSATVIPDGDTLGSVRVGRPDATVAAAHFGVGDGHDRMVVRFLGVDEDAASRAAQGILRCNTDKVDAVAGLLDEKGTVSGSEIEAVIKEVDVPRENVIVRFQTPDGNVQRTTVQAVKGEVVFDTSLVNEELFDIQSSKDDVLSDAQLRSDDFELAA